MKIPAVPRQPAGVLPAREPPARRRRRARCRARASSSGTSTSASTGFRTAQCERRSTSCSTSSRPTAAATWTAATIARRQPRRRRRSVGRAAALAASSAGGATRPPGRDLRGGWPSAARARGRAVPARHRHAAVGPARSSLGAWLGRSPVCGPQTPGMAPVRRRAGAGRAAQLLALRTGHVGRRADCASAPPTPYSRERPGGTSRGPRLR